MKNNHYFLTIAFFVVSTSAVAASCIVKDVDISIEYKGGCVNGLAEGKGQASGRDKYSGGFKEGLKHGYGIYEWAEGVRYEGEYIDDRRSGFGKLMISRSLYSEYKVSGKEVWSDGEWIGDAYVQMGLFNNGNYIMQCKSKSDCEKKKRLEDERRAREESERYERACDRFYAGKAIGFKPAGFIYFGAVLDAVVLGKGGGNVSIKITDTHFDGYGKTLEVPCASDQLR